MAYNTRTMEMIQLGRSGMNASRLAYGCMRIAGDGSRDDREKGKRAVMAAFEHGYTLFDHADIYGGGACEELMGEVLAENPGMRDKIVLLSKCGIRLAGDSDDDAPGRYDFSADYLSAQVEGSLRRLRTEQLDFLLLHRPDYLMDASEVAAVFDALSTAGKVAHFGVSNFSASQVELLQSAANVPLHVNQVQINIHETGAFTNGVLDQCQRLGMTPQAWCPIAGVAYDAWGNTFSDDDKARISAELERQSHRYEAAPWVVVLAWLMRHPVKISPIVGSTTPERIAAAVASLDIDYSREDWYRLLEARNGAAVD
ncbi:MAG: aldo/keto reductase [Woeseiaceae bacterium]|nr:aldo/keto reductase [Woeseiaceae bacterium]